MRWRYYIILLCLSLSTAAFSQKAGWVANQRGNRAFEKGQYGEAVKQYDRALQIDSTDARAYFNRGDAYLAQKNVQQAVQDFQQAAKYEKNKRVKSFSYYNMGVIAQTAANEQQDENKKQELLKEAIESYKECLRNHPQDNEARYNLALCQKQLKDSQKNQEKKQQQNKKKPQQKPQQNQQKQPQKQPQQPQPRDAQSQMMMNLSKQAEQKVRERLNQRRIERQRLEKNW